MTMIYKKLIENFGDVDISMEVNDFLKRNLLGVDWLETHEIYKIAEKLWKFEVLDPVDNYLVNYVELILVSIPGVEQAMCSNDYYYISKMSSFESENVKPKHTLEEANELSFAIQMIESNINKYYVKYLEEFADVIITGLSEIEETKVIALWMAYKMVRYVRRKSNY